ncbi:unnamed protein product [Closterium sp. NIES-65]|nr:unnamed protein product [Closterium sp. NIES-65]
MSASQLLDLLGTPHAMYAVVDSSASNSVYSCVVSLGPVTTRYTTILPCPAVPSESLTGFHVPSFSRNLVGVRPLVSQHVGVRIEPSGETAVDASPQVAASCQVPVSGPSCCVVLLPVVCTPHLWHHRMGHPSLPRLRAMSRQRLVLGLPCVLPSLPPSLAPPCGPCIEGRQRATPHSSSLRPATEPFETLHLDVWGPAPRLGPERERFFLVVVDDYSCYTTVSPLAKKSEVRRSPAEPLATRLSARGFTDQFLDRVPCFTFYHPPSHRFLDSCFEESTPYYVNYPSRGVSQATPPPWVAPRV